MRTKRILIVLPLLLGLVLLQSALWVPSYGSGAAAEAGRITTFVEATIGDAKLLNPILYSDASTGDIINRRIFDRLVEANDRLEIVPHLAESWAFTEEAFLAVRPEQRLPDGTAVTGASLLGFLERELRDGSLRELAAQVERVSLVPAAKRERTETVMQQQKGKAAPLELQVRLELPERVRFSLRRVEVDLFAGLRRLLGDAYFAPLDFDARVQVEPASARAKLAPRFAELLPVGEHNPIVTFRMRPGVRFHDGHPLTAHDVEFTYRALMTPKNISPRTASYENVDRVEVVDDLTVRVVYKKLHAIALIDWMTGILPKHRLDAPAMQREMDRRKLSPDARAAFSMRSSDFNQNPIGSGPFRFVEWRPEQYVLVERNDDYWGPKAQYERIYTRIIPDKLAQELEFQTGALDIYKVEPHQRDRYENDPRAQLIDESTGYYTYIAYNLRRPLFQDLRVRQALGMAVNVDEIIRYVLAGAGKRATGPFYSNTPYHDPSVKPLPFDPKRAAELLKEAGYVKNAEGWLEKDGKVLEFTLIANAGNAQRKAILTIAQENWRRLGIRCNTQVFEWTVYLEQFVHVRNFDAMVLGWVGADINPDKYTIWHSSQVGNYKLNFGGYVNPKADALLERIRIEYDRARQIELTRELHRLIAADQPYTFLYEPVMPHAIDRRIAILESAPGEPPRYRPITAARSGEIFYDLTRWVTRPSEVALSAE